MMDDCVSIIIGLVVSFLVFIVFAIGFGLGINSIIDEMEKYGNVRINGTTYILMEEQAYDK